MNPPSKNPAVVSSRAPGPLGPYPHARKLGNLIFLSGIGPRHPVTEQIPEGIEAQTRACIANVKAILEDAGSSLEKVVDVTVFLTNIDRDFAANVRGDPLWKDVAAVRSGRVHLSPKLPFGWVDFPPSVNRLIGLWWLAQIFYPEHFKEDIRGLTRDFYTRFYHVTPSDTDLDRVLAGRE